MARIWGRTTLIGLLSLLVLSGCGPFASAPAPLVPADAVMNGMTEAGYSPTVLSGPDVTGQLTRLKRDGVTWLAIQVAWFQKTDTSTTIAPSPTGTPTDGSVTALIRIAHRMGFRVFLNPFVNALTGSGWQADFHPSSVFRWFQSFDRYLAHYARLAQRDHADMMAIGDEFDSLDAVPAYKPYWLHAIRVARTYYKGPLVYGADWQHYQRVTFWHALNDVGIDAYFPLSATPNPSLGTLEAAWTREANTIQAWRVKAGLAAKPFIMTELGYPSERGAAAKPGTWYPSEPVNLTIQERCYLATFRTIYKRPWLRGIFWFWWANPSNPDWRGGPRDNGYTPRGKPAEAVLRYYFRASEGTTGTGAAP